MKNLRTILVTVLVAIGCAMPASAQFRIGPKLGATVNSLKFNRDVLDSENRAGFTGGLMCEFTVPVVGLGFDLSAMYVRRNARWMEVNNVVSDNRDYFTIPLNLKWKFGIPIVKPFLTTGPEVSFLTSRKAVSEAWRNKSVNWSWNFGFGLELLSHLQVAASYGIGLDKTLRNVGVDNGSTMKIDAKNRVWTITAAYLF